MEGGYDTIRRPHSASYTSKIFLVRLGRFNCVFDCFPYLKQHSFCGLFFFYSPQTVDRNKTEWCLFPFILKVIASVARGTNRRIAAKENRRRSRRWTSRWTCESYVSKCFLTVSVGQQQLGGGSSYRIRCRTRSAITVRLVGSPVNCTTVHISFFFMNRFQLHKARVFFLSFVLSGTRISFSVGAFWWLMPLPLIFLCFINKRTDGYFMFPGTTATTAAVILLRPTKIPPFPNTLVCSILNVYVLLIGGLELFYTYPS